MTTPREAVRDGKCPYCLGECWVESLLYGLHPCPACVGVGTLDAMWEHASGAYLAPSEHRTDDSFEGC